MASRADSFALALVSSELDKTWSLVFLADILNMFAASKFELF